MKLKQSRVFKTEFILIRKTNKISMITAFTTLELKVYSVIFS